MWSSWNGGVVGDTKVVCEILTCIVAEELSC